MQPPIRIRNRRGINLSTLTQVPLLSPRYINHAINDGVRDMDALRAELAGQRLGEGAEGEFGSREGGEAGGAFYGGGGAGED